MSGVCLGLTWGARGLPAPHLVILDMAAHRGHSGYWGGGPKEGSHAPWEGWVHAAWARAALFATSLRPPSSILGAQEILSPFLTLPIPTNSTARLKGKVSRLHPSLHFSY